MKVGYFPSIKNILRGSTVRQASVSSRFKVKAARRIQRESVPLIIDHHTQKDLEIFESEGSGECLFDMYNFTVTQGGSQILRQRMQEPFTSANSIRDAQQSISYIKKHKPLFGTLQFWAAGRIERYQRDPLMFVTSRDRLGFGLGAVMMKLFDSHHYYRISRGVQFTCIFIQSMREYLNQIYQHPPTGELASICEDMQTILCEPMFLKVPHVELKGSKFWKILRLDQTFRIYEKEKLQELLQLTYELDALISLADATSKYGYSIPEILDGPTKIYAKGLVHPQVKNAIPNRVSVDQKNRLFFLTGPNMAGKTTYLRAIATALYLAHLGMGVPATKFAFTPIDQLFSSISISDSVHTGTSYFLAEVLRIKAVAQAVSEGLRIVAILDEPFKGTNVIDAMEASLAVIRRLELTPNCLFLFSSHLIELADQFSSSSNIEQCHFEAMESHGKLEFDYLLKPGVSCQRLGMRVLSEAGVFELFDRKIKGVRVL